METTRSFLESYVTVGRISRVGQDCHDQWRRRSIKGEDDVSAGNHRRFTGTFGPNVLALFPCSFFQPASVSHLSDPQHFRTYKRLSNPASKPYTTFCSSTSPTSCPSRTLRILGDGLLRSPSLSQIPCRSQLLCHSKSRCRRAVKESRTHIRSYHSTAFHHRPTGFVVSLVLRLPLPESHRDILCN